MGLSKLPALSESMLLRFAALFVLHFVQGFPYGLFFYAIPTWLAANGVSAGLIGGFVSAATLPWMLKFFAGFIMDRVSFLAMGKRRAWLISSQILLAITLLISAWSAPGVSDILLLSVLAFSVNFAAAFQDAAISGLAVDLVPKDERARANGFVLAGEGIGTAIGTILSAIVIARVGLSAAFLIMMTFILVTLTFLILTRERPGERLLPWTPGAASAQTLAHSVDAWRPLITSIWRAMATPNSVRLVVAMTLNGLTLGLYTVIAPIIATKFGRWSDESFSALNGLAGLVAGVAGMVAFGIAVDRVGTKWGGSIGLFAYACIGVVFIAAAPLWYAQATFVVLVFAAFLSSTLAYIALYATAMRLCDLRVAATQFAIFLAFANFGTILAGGIVGWLDALGGTTLILAVASVFGLMGTIAFWYIGTEGDAAAEQDPSFE
ncbi:MAG: MFS transporter [Pseudomonadota bacterium]